MKKNYDERAARLAKRDALIRALFHELSKEKNVPIMSHYIFLENIFGLSDRQIRTIIVQSDDFLEVVSDDLTKLAVLLQRLSKSNKESQ